MIKRYKGRYPATRADEGSEDKRRIDKELNKMLIESYRSLFSGHGGPEDAKRVMEDILEFCMVGKVTMTGNSWTYFNEGKRAVGERIKTMANTDYLNLKGGTNG